MNRQPLATCCALGILACCHIVAAGTNALQRVSPERVRELGNLRFGMFVCWSFSTFSDKEWTPGIKNASFFNPTGFDPDQWVRTAKEAEMRYILLLTKHHDGFCLWDTKATDRKVTRSPLGRDVVDEVRRACDRQGIRLALYFSEGDWTFPGAVDGQSRKGGSNPEVKKVQLRELLTSYGPIEFIWFDHAVGDGGLSHDETTRFVKSLQPACFVGYNAGTPGGDLRLGEMGHASTLDDLSGSGFNRDHIKGYGGYLAGEFTYPILGGSTAGTPQYGRWFYTRPEWDEIATPAAKIYADYVGAVRNRNLFSLDVGPTRAGVLRDIDVRTLREVGRYIRGELIPPIGRMPNDADEGSTGVRPWE